MNLRFFIPGHPPTANERLHHLALARERKTFREAAKVVALDARNRSNGRYPLGPVRISFVFLYEVIRRRDLDNLIGSVKPIVDGIVDAGIIADDSLAYIQEIKGSWRLAVVHSIPLPAIREKPGIVVDVEEL